MSDLNLEIKIDEFSRMCDELHEQLGNTATQRQVIDNEVAKVLERTIEQTGKADVNKILHSWDFREWTTYNGVRYKLSWRLPAPLWNAIVHAHDSSIGRKLLARGLSARSWYELAKMLGYEVNAPAYVTRAASRKFTDADLEVERSETSDGYGVGITNAMPVLRFDPPGGLAALFSAIAGRVGFFKNNLARGVFDDMAKVAKKYPGIATNMTGGDS